MSGIAGLSPAQDVNIQRVSTHVITLSMSNLGTHTHITVVESKKGLVCIETEITPYIMSKIKVAAEEKLGRSDWAYVINTHNHLHHASGNALFKGTPIIGHASMNMDWLQKQLSTEAGRRRYCDSVGVSTAIPRLQQALNQPSVSPLQKRELRRRLEFCQAVEQECMAGFDVVNPTLTFEDRYALDLDDVHLQLTYWGEGINHSSIFVQVAEDKLLVSTGMGKAWIPDFYGQPNLESLKRAVTLWKELSDKNFPVDRIVGVHSPQLIFGREQFHHRAVYLQTLLTDLTEATQQGMSLEQVKETFSLNRRHAPLARLFTKPDDLEAVHQKNIEKIWPLLQSEDRALNN